MTRSEFEAVAIPQVFQGYDPSEYTEADVALELAEDGWPDHCRWQHVWCRIKDGGELTEQERESALVYIACGEDFPPDEMRLPKSNARRTR